MIVDTVLTSRTEGKLTAGELEVLMQSVVEERVYEARTTIARHGVPLNTSTFLLEGFMSRYIDDRNGQRQLVAVQVTGDFVDLHAYPLQHLDHDVGTLTAARVAFIPHKRLWEIQCEYPALARKLWFLTLLDAAMHRVWVFRLGRLNAVSRVAHFLCETNARLFSIGHSDGSTFALPLTQFDLGDICGLTSIHVNRVLRELRERNLCTFRSGAVVIHDLEGLARIGHFDPAYLYLATEVTTRLSNAGKKVADRVDDAKF